MAERLSTRQVAALRLVGSQPTALFTLAKTAAGLVLGERATPARRRLLGARAEDARGWRRSRAVRRDAGRPGGVPASGFMAANHFVHRTYGPERQNSP